MTAPFTPRRDVAEDRLVVEKALSALLPPATTHPARLHEALHYALFAGGKRLRPLLVLAACRACEGEDRQAMAAAAAIEMIHTYSLVHDDLPAMDDDSLRRGQPTTHVVYGEGMAILVGDALLTRAAEILCGSTTAAGLDPVPPAAAAALMAAAGSTGMIGGQALDLASQGLHLPLEQLEDLHRRKTGALIRASLLAGGHCAGGSAAQLEALGRCGTALGLAFQIVDDILDVTGKPGDLGKSAGKDERAGKLTFPALMGLQASRRRAAELAGESRDALAPLGAAADPMRDLVRRATERIS
ncbi:MAG: polyprenyl synthetase family protein [Acidobacteria bacterium]|nr:MAG: polyprenyl synthetase family protein [Acidobacteriota bacterium]